MRSVNIVTTGALAAALRALPDHPRVVISGNHSVPWEAVRLLDEQVERYVLNMLNGPPGVADRAGVTLETSFVGAGQRRRGGLSYVPCRLSLVPVLFRERLPVDAVILHCAPPRNGYLSLAFNDRGQLAAVRPDQEWLYAVTLDRLNNALKEAVES